MVTGGSSLGVSGNPLLRAVSEQAMMDTPYDNAFDGRNESDLTMFDVWTGNWGPGGGGSDHVVFDQYLGICIIY